MLIKTLRLPKKRKRDHRNKQYRNIDWLRMRATLCMLNKPPTPFTKGRTFAIFFLPRWAYIIKTAWKGVLFVSKTNPRSFSFFAFSVYFFTIKIPGLHFFVLHTVALNVCYISYLHFVKFHGHIFLSCELIYCLF